MIKDDNIILSVPGQTLGWIELAKFFGVPCDEGQICASEKINMWARFKPEVLRYRGFRHVMPITLEERRQNTWGLEIPIFESIQSLKNAFADGKAAWVYNRPDGSPQEPARITDFVDMTQPDVVGYKHDCECFVQCFSDTTVTINDAGHGFNLSFEHVIHTDDQFNLAAKDFQFNGVNAEDMYLGLLLVRSGDFKYLTSDKTIGDSESFDISTVLTGGTSAGIADKTWRMYPFLSSVHFDLNDQQDRTGVYVPFDMQERKAGSQGGYILNVNTSSSQYTWFVDAYYVIEGINKYLYYHLQIFNPRSSAKEFTDIVMVVKRDPNGATVLPDIKIGNISVPARKSDTEQGKFETSNTILLPNDYDVNEVAWIGVQSSNTGGLQLEHTWQQVEQKLPDN